MSAITVDHDLVRRLDKPGPRYTSYPTAVEFHDEVAGNEYGLHLAAADRRGADVPLSLYFHLPFCEHRCAFCGCHVVITRHREIAAGYLDYLYKEIQLTTDLLPHRRKVSQLHLGGGTPTYMSPDQLRDLLYVVTSEFDIDREAEVAVEVDPRVTTREHLDTLVELGFNRLSLGVQDLTPEVQVAIDRNQTYKQTLDLVSYARSVGFDEGINVDLIYGLPLQKPETFEQNLEQIIGLRPDRVAMYSFAYVPWIKGHQKNIDTTTLPPPDMKLDLYLMGLEAFLNAGYDPIGMDHFALPDDELSRAARVRKLHRNFMGYTVRPAPDMVAFGISGIGDVTAGYFQNVKKLSTYYDSLDNGRFPVERGYLLDDDDVLRRDLITQLMCNFFVDKAELENRYGISFDTYFASSLQKLEELGREGIVVFDGASVSVPDAGRLFVRNVCMAFDRYRDAKAETKPVFSRTV